MKVSDDKYKKSDSSEPDFLADNKVKQSNIYVFIYLLTYYEVWPGIFSALIS